jgi:tetratricopeptide (TPR) repeat protein
MSGAGNLKKGMFKDAINDLTNAIAQNPIGHEAYQYRGLAYFILGENKKALEDLKQSLRIHPVDDFVLFILELLNKQDAFK